MDKQLRAVIVCVKYWDYLSICLPYNRHHFSEVCIVTDSRDFECEENLDLCDRMDCAIVVTDLFYEDGADFNKWKALEYGLDCFGRRGWLCIMDADILWPKSLPYFPLEEGKLYTPYRRMMTEFSGTIPPESQWLSYPRHRNVAEWAGYSQIFSSEDWHLPEPPWHETNWRHAGGADSFFQRLWPVSEKVRPPFEVLHLGRPGTNWCGRITPYLDGTVPADSEESRKKLKRLIAGRRNRPRGSDPFSSERIPG